MTQDNLGDRMKLYERRETDRIVCPRLPIYARIDGRCFSKFTKKLNKPFDERFVKTMIDTTASLVHETNAIIGYTQSDEISLLWYNDKPDGEIFFNGRIFKITSNLASLTTAFFIKHFCDYFDVDISNMFSQYGMPSFDCRVFELPSKTEAVNAILWRELDATKNAISSAAHSMFSHKSLQNLNGKQMQEKMWQEKNINFNDYPAYFKRGTFVRKEIIEYTPPQDVLDKIPQEYRELNNTVYRSRMVNFHLPKLSSVSNRVDVIFEKAEPIEE